MQHQWFSNLPKDKQEEFKNLVRGSQKVLDRAREICYNKIMELESPATADYDSPSWAYKQADRNGYIRALRELEKLLTIE